MAGPVLASHGLIHPSDDSGRPVQRALTTIDGYVSSARAVLREPKVRRQATATTCTGSRPARWGEWHIDRVRLLMASSAVSDWHPVGMCAPSQGPPGEEPEGRPTVSGPSPGGGAHSAPTGPS